MALTRKTWIWIIVGVLGFGVVCIIAIAGMGVYFVSHHVSASRTSSTEAFRAFDEARMPFKDERPIYEMDEREHPRQVRQFADLPTSTVKPELMWILAWDPDRERLVKVSIPFWLLRLGRQNVDISSGGFDFQRLQLDVNELSRVGPVILVEHRSLGGERVMVWTR